MWLFSQSDKRTYRFFLLNEDMLSRKEKKMEKDAQFKIIESQIRECFGKVVVTHKTHEECADILNRWNALFRWLQILVSALVTGGVLTTIFENSGWVKTVSALLSFFLLCLNTYLKNYDLGALAQKHIEAAAELWDIRESYLSLLADFNAGLTDVQDVLLARNRLQERLSKLYKGTPRTLSKAYRDATRLLKLNEELPLTDDEIDAFLPNELKRKGNGNSVAV